MRAGVLVLFGVALVTYACNDNATMPLAVPTNAAFTVSEDTSVVCSLTNCRAPTDEEVDGIYETVYHSTDLENPDCLRLFAGFASALRAGQLMIGTAGLINGQGYAGAYEYQTTTIYIHENKLTSPGELQRTAIHEASHYLRDDHYSTPYNENLAAYCENPC